MRGGVGSGLAADEEKVLSVIGQWLRYNVHTLTENELLAVIYCLHKLEYIDDAVIATMEK